MRSVFDFVFISIVIGLTLCPILVYSQNADTIPKLLDPTDDTRAHTLFLAFGYNYTPRNHTFNTNGKEFNVGLNLARLFTRKVFIGINFGFSVINWGSKQRFSKQFAADFNEHYDDNYDSEVDSLASLTLKNGINQIDGFYSSGNQFSSIGIMISPFPDRYGGFAFRYNRVDYLFPFRGKYRSILYPSRNDESNTPNFYGVKADKFEISMKPYFLFKKGAIDFINGDDFKFKYFYKFLIISFHVEVLDLSDSQFFDRPLNNYVSQTFIDKYQKDIHFGFKLSLGFY